MYLARMLILASIILNLSLSLAFSQELPGTRWQLNPENKFKEKEGSAKFSGANGFTAHFVGGDLEVQVKGTKIENSVVAQQMTSVEFSNIEKLYSARGNPYEGQITEIIACDKIYAPRSIKFKVGLEDRRALMVGANERRLFGACAKDQIAYWASYFNFYDAPSKMVIESRLFLNAPKPNAKQVNELSKKLEKISKELLVMKASP